MIYITGDMHAKFAPIEAICEKYNTTTDDILIILGDAGINFHGEAKDRKKKDYLRTLPITLFSVHGNHDMRPASIPFYKEVDFHGAPAYMEDGYETLLFAKCGEIYELDGLSTLVLGGAYSLDKAFRLALKWPWFEDEQPSDEIKRLAKENIAAKNHKVDVVLSHTAPLSHLPFSGMPKLKTIEIDTTTEEWLDAIEKTLDYEHWYCGHFHLDRQIGRFTFMMDEVLPFGHFRMANESTPQTD